MLLKVETVEEIGRFKSLKHQAPQFGKLTAVFARNGLGKSTVCSIIRSAAEQDPKLLAARRRLGAQKDTAVHLHWQTHGAVTYSTNGWSSCPGPIHIFDSEFVRRNLHVGESVTRDNKRSLIPIVLGEEGVRLANKISELDAEQRELATKLSVIEPVIRRTCPVVTDIKTFSSKEVPSDIDDIILRSTKSLELAKNTDAVKQKPAPTLLPSIRLDDIERILAATVSTLSEDAEMTLKDHLLSHSMNDVGVRWLKYGVEHIDSERCPFCTQDISKVDIVSVFKGYFSSAYAELVRNIDDNYDLLTQRYGVEGRLLKDFISKTHTDLNFWNGVCELSQLPCLSSEDVERIVQSYISVIALLERKKANPLSAITLEDRDYVADSLDLFDLYQAQITSCIAEIEAARRNVGESNLQRAQEVYDKNCALRTKLSPPLSDEVAQWIAHTNRRAAIESEKKMAQESLRSYTKMTIDKKQSAINELLNHFGARFEITRTKTTFIGREANVHFSVSIGEHAIEVGERVVDKPCFTTVLSAGDKSTLAFAFFLLQVRESKTTAQSIVVLDDPFSSQDMDRQWETTSQIRKLADEVCQVIVFSHDPRFLALIEKNAQSIFYSCQLVCDDEGKGAFKIWNCSDELKEIYVRQAERIREFARHGRFLPDVTAESLIKDLRPFLEDYLRARFPGRFAPFVMLDGMTNDIEAAGNDDPLYPKVTDLRAINEFSRDNMHGGASAPVPGSLRAQCKRIAAIIGAY